MPSTAQSPQTPTLTKAVARFIRVSPRKARLVADLVRGRSVGEARSTLQYSPQAAARLIAKVLRSAVANAEHNHQVRDLDGLEVGITIDGGPSLKRIQPRAMGRAFHILHRTSHITVTLREPAGGAGRLESRRPRAGSPPAGRPARGETRGARSPKTRSA
jgi:large subunit ribosomal protein L22